MKNEKIKCQGIVLKTTDYKESGNLITILTSEGLKSLIVRGTKKVSTKMRGLTNIFSVIDFVQTNHDGLNTIVEGVTVKSYSGLYDNVLNMAYAQVLLEKVMVLSASITDYQILYNFLMDILDILSISKEPALITLIFEVKLLYLLGLSPNFKNCTLCHKTTTGRFVLSEGGIVCNKCFRPQNYFLHLTIEETDVFKLIYLIKLSNVSQMLLDAIKPFYQRLNLFIDQYYNYFLDFNAKTKKIINQLTAS